MKPWERLHKTRDKRRSGEKRLIFVEDTINQEVVRLAKLEKKPVEEILGILIARGLEQKKAAEEVLDLWQTLTSREMEVAAFTCLGLSSRETATRLKMSIETVKTHRDHIFRKFNISTRGQLKATFKDWDFSEWKNFRYIRGRGPGHPKR